MGEAPVIRIGDLVRLLPQGDVWDNCLGRVSDYGEGEDETYEEPDMFVTLLESRLPGVDSVLCNVTAMRRLSPLEELALEAE